MKTFAIILVVGILLAAAVPILLRCNRSADIARHEGFTVAGSLRSAIFQLVLQGAASFQQEATPTKGWAISRVPRPMA